MMNAEGADAGPLQAALRFLHENTGPLASMSSYDIRMVLRERLPLAPMDAITVQPSLMTVLLSARSPAASLWMQDNLGEVMGCVAEMAGKELAVTPTQTRVMAEATANQYLYKFPRLIVASAKRTASWDGWRKPELDSELRAQLLAIIRSGLSQELEAWGCSALDAPITLLSEGRPMPISPERGPRGMARIGVKFIAPTRIEGNLFAGIHTLMGHGALHLGGAVSKSTNAGVAP